MRTDSIILIGCYTCIVTVHCGLSLSIYYSVSQRIGSTHNRPEILTMANDDDQPNPFKAGIKKKNKKDLSLDMKNGSETTNGGEVQEFLKRTNLSCFTLAAKKSSDRKGRRKLIPNHISFI